jgi:hypothetical protein
MVYLRSCSLLSSSLPLSLSSSKISRSSPWLLRFVRPVRQQCVSSSSSSKGIPKGLTRTYVDRFDGNPSFSKIQTIFLWNNKKKIFSLHYPHNHHVRQFCSSSKNPDHNNNNNFISIEEFSMKMDELLRLIPPECSTKTIGSKHSPDFVVSDSVERISKLT